MYIHKCSSSIYVLVLLELQERPFIMAWNDLTTSSPHELLETLRRPEPRWMVSSQPALRNPIAPLESISILRTLPMQETTHILNHVAMIADEQERSILRHIDLHANKSIRVAWKMMQRNALTKVKGSLIKSLPITAMKLSAGRSHSIPVSQLTDQASDSASGILRHLRLLRQTKMRSAIQDHAPRFRRPCDPRIDPTRQHGPNASVR